MGKGSNTTTSQSSTAPTAQGLGIYNQILGLAGNAASTPYQSYTGELTAPVNAQQTAGIAGINANANYASPYISQAAGLATGAANPLTSAQINNYLSPYTQDVVNATQAQFNNQNQQQQAQLTGNTIAQGALGGNRAGVAQASLAGQQQLAQAPVIAGLYNSGYQNAVQTAAQQYQQNPLAAASSIANFGISGQNAALSGANAQLGAGTLQQQTQQAQDQALYQQFLQQQAYPFQTAQYYANIAGPIAGALGTNSSGTTTAPAPNQTAQYLGLGLAGLSLLNRGGAVHRDSGGGIGSTPYAGVSGYVPQSQSLGVRMASAAGFPQVANTSGQTTANNQAIQGLVGKLGSGSGSSGGLSDHISDYLSDLGSGDAASIGEYLALARGGVAGFRGYADGGAPDDQTFADRWDPTYSSDPVKDQNRAAGLQMLRDKMGVINPDEPFRMPDQAAVDQWRQDTPVVTPTGAPVVARDDEEAAPAPRAGVADLVRPTVAPAQPFSRDDAQAGFGAAPSDKPQSSFGLGLFSPQTQHALLAAGLGMLASRSPFLGNAIGEGGLAGLNAYGADQAAALKARQDEIKVQQEAQRLQQEAQRTADDFALRAAGQKETARHNQAVEQKEYKPTWGVINEVTDPQSGTQRKTYGWIDPNKKAITDAQGNPVTQSTSPTPPPGSQAQAQQLEGDEWAKTVPADRAFRAKMIANYEENPSDLPTRGGLRAAAVADAKHFNKDYNEQNFQASQRAYTNFNAGQEARTIRSLNVATDHLDTLRQAAAALGNGNFTLANSFMQKYREATGSPLPTNFDSIKQAVSSEIAKVVVGGQTALQDRDEMSNRASHSQSPDQLNGIFDGFTKLMGGQMKGLKQQYESTTYRKDFDKYLLPSTKSAINAAIGSSEKGTWEHQAEAAPPTAAVEMLRKNPALAPQFDAKYGSGASRQYLGAP